MTYVKESKLSAECDKDDLCDEEEKKNKKDEDMKRSSMFKDYVVNQY